MSLIANKIYFDKEKTTCDLIYLLAKFGLLKGRFKFEMALGLGSKQIIFEPSKKQICLQIQTELTHGFVHRVTGLTAYIGKI